MLFYYSNQDKLKHQYCLLHCFCRVLFSQFSSFLRFYNPFLYILRKFPENQLGCKSPEDVAFVPGLFAFPCWLRRGGHLARWLRCLHCSSFWYLNNLEMKVFLGEREKKKPKHTKWSSQRKKTEIKHATRVLWYPSSVLSDIWLWHFTQTRGRSLIQDNTIWVRARMPTQTHFSSFSIGYLLKYVMDGETQAFLFSEEKMLLRVFYQFIGGKSKSG